MSETDKLDKNGKNMCKASYRKDEMVRAKQFNVNVCKAINTKKEMIRGRQTSIETV